MRHIKFSSNYYHISARNLSGPTLYQRIKSYLPASFAKIGKNENENIREYDELSFLTDRHLHDYSNLIQLSSTSSSKLIYVIGVSHDSRLSALRVKSLCDDVWPDTIFLELDKNRLQQIRLKLALQSPLSNAWKSLIHRLSNYTLFNRYKHGPFIEAICYGDKKQTNIECGDIDSKVIMNELKKALESKRKPFEEIINEKKYVSYLFLNQVINEYIMHMKNLFNIGNNDENILRREKKNQKIEKSRKEARDIVNGYSSTVYQILHQQRDEYMISKLIECDGDIIVAIVGMGHLDGLEQCWKELNCNKKVKVNH